MVSDWRQYNSVCTWVGYISHGLTKDLLKQLTEGRIYLDLWFQRGRSSSFRGNIATSSRHGSWNKKLRSHILNPNIKRRMDRRW